ncbi:MAG: MarC family protein [Oceanicaulis sp.]
MDVEFFTRFLAAFFAMLNPLAAMPVFLSLTEGEDEASRRRTAITATIATIVACFAVALVGRQVLGLFGIAIDSFRIAGGILLFNIALTMISGARHASSAGAERERGQMQKIDNPAIYPFTIPMTVGPGTIATLIIFSEQVTSPVRAGLFAAVILIVVAALFTALMIAPMIDRVVSQSARTVSVRIMGIILAALAVEFVITGLRGSGLIGTVAAAL